MLFTCCSATLSNNGRSGKEARSSRSSSAVGPGRPCPGRGRSSPRAGSCEPSALPSPRGLRWLWTVQPARRLPLLLLASAPLLCAGDVYVERDRIEPFQTNGFETIMLQGVVVPAAPSGSLRVRFTTYSYVPTETDVATARIYKNGSFSLHELDDCWQESLNPQNCCSEAMVAQCFDNIYTRDRCCTRLPAGRDFLSQSMREARIAAAPGLPDLVVKNETFDRRRLAYRRGHFEESCLSPSGLGNLSLREAYAVLLASGRANRTAFHVGINDGMSGDPLYPLIMAEGLRGVGLEANKDLVNQSRFNLPGRFKAVHTWVTPNSVWQWAGPLEALDIVVVDIDSFECDVVETLLDMSLRREARVGIPPPALLFVEMNTVVPPPFQYSRLWSSAVRDVVALGQIRTSSCSLSYAVAAFGRRGYELLVYDYNAIFVRRDLVRLYQTAWGHRFPKDEFMCYRQSVAHAVGMSVKHVRQIFFAQDEFRHYSMERLLAHVEAWVLEANDPLQNYPYKLMV